MKKLNVGRLLAFALLAWGLSASETQGQTTRWLDKAVSGEGGSFELSFQKRLFEPMMEEMMCERCRHYVELRYGVDDEDIDSIDFDIEHLIAAYRYYVYVEKERETWAAYVGVGLGRYELDPGDTFSGWNYRVGVDVSATKSCKNGKLKSWFMDWEVNATRHSIEVPGGDLDYWSYHTGPRFLFASSRDKERAERLGSCRKGASPQQDYEDGA